MKQINLLVHTAFILGKSDHAFLRHRWFIIWPWNFKVKVSAEFKKNVLVNLVAMLMAKTYSKYGMNTYISIFPFYLRPYFNVKFTMKHSGHLWAYFSTQILSYCHKCLASNLESYFVSYKRQFKFKHKHYYGSLSHLVRYVFLVIVGLGYKLEVFTHSYKLPDNYWYVFSQHPYPMLQIHSIKNTIFRGANFGAYTDPSLVDIILALHESDWYILN